jgi:hypothetical protein
LLRESTIGYIVTGQCTVLVPVSVYRRNHRRVQGPATLFPSASADILSTWQVIIDVAKLYNMEIMISGISKLFTFEWEDLPHIALGLRPRAI